MPSPTSYRTVGTDPYVQNMYVANALPTTVRHGKTTVTTAGTEVALAASQALQSGVRIKALAANTGIIYVGGNPVTNLTGYELAPGEEVFVEVDNLATVFIDASVNSQGVSWIGA